MGAGDDGRDMSVSLEDSWRGACRVSKLGWAEAMEVESLTSGRMFLGSHRPLASVISAPIGTTFHSH